MLRPHPTNCEVMKQIGTVCLAGLSAFSAILGGCGDSTTPLNTSQLFSPSADSSPAMAKAQRPLLYATAGDSQMLVYLYPHLKQRFDLSPGAQPERECSDRQGDVFVFTLDGLVEYHHGGVSPVTTIDVEGESCSVDPVTGDLAVTEEYESEILIFRDTKLGWHLPATRTVSFQPASCAYDDQGNLYVDATLGGKLALAELPKGMKTFTSIEVNQPFKLAGSVQWDGAYLAVTQSANPPAIYRYLINGTAATLAGKTSLKGANILAETWIFSRHVVAAADSGIYIWKYPQGGSFVKTIAIETAGGVTVSI